MGSDSELNRREPGSRAVNALAALALFGWRGLLRLPTFLRAVIDWDESVYLVIADRWMRGGLPYVAAWERKPIGIFLLFRLALTLFGRSVTSIRLLAVIAVWVAALALFLIAQRLFQSRRAGLIAAIAYPAFSLTLGGTAANTEIFFVTAMLLGVGCLLRGADGPERVTWAAVCGAGLLLGAAIQIKYVVLPEVLFFSAIMLVNERRAIPRVPGSRQAARLALFCVALALPTLLAAAYFVSLGHATEFVDANLLANLRDQPALRNLAQPLLESMLRWLFATAPVWAALGSLWLLSGRMPGMGGTPAALAERVLLAWVAVAIVESWLTRRFSMHCYLVTLPPICLLLASIARSARHGHDRIGRGYRRAARPRCGKNGVLSVDPGSPQARAGARRPTERAHRATPRRGRRDLRRER